MPASLRRKLLSTIALFALSTLVSWPVRAHNGANQVITAVPAIPASAAVEAAAGTIDVLVVDNRVTGTTTRYTLLRRDDGTVVGLQGAAAESLFAGTRVATSGRRAGGTLVADSVSVLSGPSAAAVTPAEPAQVQGTLLLAHVDDFEHGRGEFRLVVRADNGHATELRTGVIPDVLRTGMTVVAHGTPSADELGLDTSRIEVLALPAADRMKAAQDSPLQSPLTNNVLVLLVKFTDNVEPFTSAAVQNVMVTSATSVANYYSEASFGQQQLNVTVTPNWLQSGIAKPSTCSYSTIGNLADNAYAAAFPNDHTTYQNRFYVFPQLGSCGWAGLAYVGFGLAYSNGYNTLGVFGHELGHNFGLLHAGSLSCAGASMCSSGAVTEYGDRFDIMGNTNTGGTHFNAAQKSILNWIPLTSVKTHNGGTATYTLSPIESPGGTSYAVKIPAASNRTYWIEYRQPVGFDSALSSYPNNGAQIRVASPFESASGFDDTELLDMTPATGTFTDAALVAGQSYTDSTYGVTITVGTASPSALNVTVSSGSGGKTTSTTALASNPNPSASGTSATFTATVSGSAPTGTVNFKDGAGSIGGCSAVALAGSGNSRTATCTTSALAIGTHSITASYGGDANNTASTSAALSQTVSNIVQSRTTAVSSLNPSTSGASVTFTATVTGASPLTGSVNFTEGPSAISLTGCSAVQLPAGSATTKTASCTTSTLSVGTHSIGVFYGGNISNVPSSTTLSQVVNAGGLTPTTTTLASSKNPSTFGGSVIFTATVTGSNPTGNVNFKDGAASIGGCSAKALSGSGNTRTATCTSTGLNAVTHSITAAYAGDSNNAASTSAALSQVVNKSASTTALASSKNPSTFGINVTFTATVTGVAPTGSVNFKDGAGSIAGCSAVALAGSGNTRTAGCTISGLSVATHSITAAYGGDGGNVASTSASLSQVVNKAASTTALASSKNPSTSGASVTFTATVTGVAPTGSVNFKDGVSSIAGCSASALSGSGNSRTATCTTSSLSVATHSITAAYVGDGSNAAATSAALSQVVNSAGPTGTTTTLASSKNPSTFGAGVTFTATVTGTSPTGSVNFKDGAGSIAGCSAMALSAGKATCTTSALSVATHSITAAYGGDAGNAASTSAALSQVVNSAGSSINVALASNGGVATASSSYSSAYPVSAINNNERAGTNWGSGSGGWNDGTRTVFPDWVQIDFSGSKTIDRVVVYTLQDNYPSPVEPSDTMTFTTYGITAFTVQGWNGSAWVSLSSVSGNNLVKRTVSFAAYTTSRIRINVTGALLNYSRITEVEAWGTGAAGPPASTTTLNSSPNPSTVGTSVTFTATVTGTGPTGSVNFKDGGSSIAGCSAAALAGSGNSRSAQCTTSALAAGTHSVTAAYGGDAGNAASTSGAMSQTVNAGGGGAINVALASNGGLASASSSYNAGYPASAINNNERAGVNWGSGGGWNDATAGAYPDWVQIAFSGSKTIDHVIVYTLQDNYASPVEPTDTMTFSLYGITAFTVQSKQGNKWVTLATVSGNNLVKRRVDFAPSTTSKIRVMMTGALASFSRITEVEAWGN